MVRLSVLSFSSLLLGSFMFSTGLACYFKDLSSYEKEDAHNAILRVFIGSVMIVFVPIVYASLTSCGAMPGVLDSAG
ncbi:unnamed protein product [Chrysodeixis includens]|uniref:Uncharacterized protein n=1 Tax=Chrysodeixis includens TaxID=689277 RepID=A0A9P0BPV5_CHRIL|nr:unnamed protein product [Chrysodeixis includens]